MQEGIFIFERLQPGIPLYNMQLVIPFDAPPEGDNVQHAIDWLVRRHEGLRLRFEIVDGTARQWVDDTLRVQLRELRLPTGREDALSLAIGRAVRRPFNLRTGPPLRAVLLHADNRQSVLVLVLHHLVGDGWSTDILASEFRQAYTSLLKSGGPPAMPPVAGYLSFCRWQQRILRDSRLDEAIGDCSSEFSGITQPATLPSDRPRRPRRQYLGGHVWVYLPKDMTAAVRSLAQERRTTANTIYLTGLAILLGRMSGQDRFAVGMPVLNRDRAEWQKSVGLFTNTVPLALPTTGRNFLALAQEVAETVRSALTRSWIPFDVVIERLNPDRVPGCHPLFKSCTRSRNRNSPCQQNLPREFLPEQLNLTFRSI